MIHEIYCAFSVHFLCMFWHMKTLAISFDIISFPHLFTICLKHSLFHAQLLTTVCWAKIFYRLTLVPVIACPCFSIQATWNLKDRSQSVLSFSHQIMATFIENVWGELDEPVDVRCITKWKWAHFYGSLRWRR